MSILPTTRFLWRDDLLVMEPWKDGGMLLDGGLLYPQRPGRFGFGRGAVISPWQIGHCNG